MKKNIFFALTLVMLFCMLVACNKTSSTDETQNKSTNCEDIPQNSNNLAGGTAETFQQYMKQNVERIRQADYEKIQKSFEQFNMDVERVKPNLGTPLYDNIVNNCKLDVDNGKVAYWTEVSDIKIDRVILIAYYSWMFDYCKSISDDGKCYITRLYGKDQRREEITSYEAINKAIDDGWYHIPDGGWYYKANGMWIWVKWTIDPEMRVPSKSSPYIGIQLYGEKHIKR
jgi:hypothetical protein